MLTGAGAPAGERRMGRDLCRRRSSLAAPEAGAGLGRHHRRDGLSTGGRPAKMSMAGPGGRGRCTCMRPYWF